MRPHRLSYPPPALRRAKLDNLALIPARLLPFKAEWQDVANSLPQGDVLVVLPENDRPARKSFELVATLLQAKGYRVTTIPAEQLL